MRTVRAIGLCLALAPAAAWAQPVALVLDVQGEVPGIELFQEIAAGTKLTVGPGAMVMLEHYAACEAATVTGGTVTVGPGGLDLGAAQVAMHRRVDCPKVIRLAEDTVTAGVILRSVVAIHPVGLAPSVVVAGGAAADVDRLTIRRDGRDIVTLPVRGGRVDWPAGGLFLSDGVRYQFVLGGGAGEHAIDVIAGRDGPARVVVGPPG